MRFFTVLMLGTVLVIPLASGATLTTEPEKVVFDRASGSATVRVLADGVPVPAAHIRGFHLMAGKSDYSHMFRFAKADGAVTLTPSPTVESGSFDLRIDTALGDAWLKVYTPLGEDPTSLETLAKKLNMPVEELRNEAGLCREMKRSGGVEMELPPVFPVGKTLTMDMAPAADIRARWQVDHETVSESAGKGVLTYLFREAGSHLFTYTEFKGDAVTAQASAIVKGVETPAIDVSVNVGDTLTLTAPEGYGQHTWTIDGAPAGTGASLDVKRSTPGEAVVTVLSEKPSTGRPEEFERVLYRVKIVPKQK